MVNPITIQPVVGQSITPAVKETDAPGRTQTTANTSITSTGKGASITSTGKGASITSTGKGANGSTAPGESSSANQVGHANPSYQFDPAAGVVVIQFRSASGKVELSIPNQQQLDAYAAKRSGDPQQTSDAVVA